LSARSRRSAELQVLDCGGKMTSNQPVDYRGSENWDGKRNITRGGVNVTKRSFNLPRKKRPGRSRPLKRSGGEAGDKQFDKKMRLATGGTYRWVRNRYGLRLVPYRWGSTAEERERVGRKKK